MVEKEAPVFIQIKEYRELLDVMDLIKSKIVVAKETLSSINDVRKEEDEQIAYWTELLEEITSKLYAMDKTLFEPGY